MRTHSRTVAGLIAGIVALATIALAGAPLAAQEEGSSSASEDVVEAVNELRDRFLATYRDTAPAEGASLFAEQGVLMPQASAQARGREAIQSRLESFLSDQTVSMGAISEETFELEDRVLDRGILSIEVSPKGTEEKGSDTGKYVLVARQGDGGWEIEWFIWSLDHPLRTVQTQAEED